MAKNKVSVAFNFTDDGNQQTQMKKNIPVEIYQEDLPLDFLVGMFKDFLRSTNNFDENEVESVVVLHDDEMVTLKPKNAVEKELLTIKETYSEDDDNG